MIERAVAFGAGGTLIGVLCEPAAEKVIASAPAVLMWNVGIQHRVGPYRIQVDLARDLARRGFASVRFDLSGMGDSEARYGGPVDLPGALDDLRDAMSLLEKRRGTRSFVVIGFCSSVDSAHALALKDERVVGACFLEGYAYRTRGYWLHYPKRLLSRHRWKRYLGRHLNGFGSRGAPSRGNPLHEERAAMGSVFARQYPTPEQFAADVHRLHRRGARMLFIYVGGDSEFNHLGQFSEMIGSSTLGDRIDIEYYGDADHTFFRVTDRQRVVDRVGRWMSERIGGRPVQAADRSMENGPRKPSGMNPDTTDGRSEDPVESPVRIA
jgi:hypothetical protein